MWSRSQRATAKREGKVLVCLAVDDLSYELVATKIVDKEVAHRVVALLSDLARTENKRSKRKRGKEKPDGQG